MLTLDDLRDVADWNQRRAKGEEIADLSGADLRGANLSGADGIICLHIGDPRGYRAIAVRHADKWMIYAGCRWLTAADALMHWSAADYHTPKLGQAYVRAIAELPAIAEGGDDG